MSDPGTPVIRIDGDYEVSFEKTKEDARMNRWHFVSSTSWNEFYDDTSRHLMQGCMVVAEEVLSALTAPEKLPPFLSGGVGSIAAAIFLGIFIHLQRSEGSADGAMKSMARFIKFKILEADSLFQTGLNEGLQASQGSLRPLMAGLAWRTQSPVA